MGLDMDMDTTSERGLLMPSLRLRLTLLFSMVPMDTLVLAMLDTEDLATLPMLDILIPVMDTLPTPHTPMDTTLARGLLMLIPRLRLTLLCFMVPMDTHILGDMLDMDMVDMLGANK